MFFGNTVVVLHNYVLLSITGVKHVQKDAFILEFAKAFDTVPYE